MKFFSPFFITLALSAPFAAVAQNDVLKKLDPFLGNHCLECHDDVTAEGDLDLSSMDFDLSNPRSFEIWQSVYERTHNGEMPPKKKARPGADEIKAFLTPLKSSLDAVDKSIIANYGRVHSRRLTRVEYENTLHDLLGVDIPLVDYLPADDGGHGFETEAESQQLSHFHLDKYLIAADAALDEAFQRVGRGDKEWKKRFGAKELSRGVGRGNYRGPDVRNGEIICWPMRVQFYGRMPETRVPESGWYRITIKNLRAINPGPLGTVWGTLRTGYGYSSDPVLFSVASLEGVKTPRDHVYEAWIKEEHLIEIKPNESGLKAPPSGATGGKVSFKGRDLAKQGFSGLAFEYLELERIYPNATRWEVRGKLLPGVKFDKGKPLFKDPQAELDRLVTHFASRAFRRPVTPEQAAPYKTLARAAFKETGKFPVALHAGYRAILCSPRFLTFVETPGKLDDHAIASRLSYTFWTSMPDSTLRKLADEKKLGDWKVVAGQVERMLADPKADRFIASFTDQWLNLKEIDFTQPDPRRFSSFDPVVKDSMVQETRGFVKELIDKNLSATNLVQSDFGMLNTRLKRHYLLKDAKVAPGNGLQKVSLGNTYRGGLITQASVLKVTADGSVTSPILRGIWINERILGQETPPPPSNVPAIEPDIRGAVSIRDQLAKHSNEADCAACHAIIDPAGFALENFDPIGQWRTAYGPKKTSAKVDPSGVTPGGDTFKNIGDWKKIYVNQPDLLARAFAKKFLTYATGASPRFSDDETLNRIVKATKSKNYGLRTIIHQSIASDIFRTK